MAISEDRIALATTSKALGAARGIVEIYSREGSNWFKQDEISKSKNETNEYFVWSLGLHADSITFDTIYQADPYYLFEYEAGAWQRADTPPATCHGEVAIGGNIAVQGCAGTNLYVRRAQSWERATTLSAGGSPAVDQDVVFLSGPDGIYIYE